jgi:hypothetical protein
MAQDSYEFDPTPGYTKPTHTQGLEFGDDFHAPAVAELLLSMVGYTQRGVTLAGGQGVLPTGSIIARHTASGKYFLYQPGATDGRQTPAGVLRDGRDTGGTGGTPAGYTFSGQTPSYAASPAGKVAADCQGNLVIRGTLNLNVMSGTDATNIINGNGVGSGAGQAISLLGGRVLALGGSISGASQGSPFPGGPMDGGNTAGTAGTTAFIF